MRKQFAVSLKGWLCAFSFVVPTHLIPLCISSSVWAPRCPSLMFVRGREMRTMPAIKTLALERQCWSVGVIVHTMCTQLSMRSLILLSSHLAALWFRGGAASLRPSAGGDSEKSLCQPGDLPDYHNIPGQTSYHYWQDQGSQRGGKVTLFFITTHPRPLNRNWQNPPPPRPQVWSAACRWHPPVNRQDQHWALLADGGHAATGQHCWCGETGDSPGQPEWTLCQASRHRYVARWH